MKVLTVTVTATVKNADNDKIVEGDGSNVESDKYHEKMDEDKDVNIREHKHTRTHICTYKSTHVCIERMKKLGQKARGAAQKKKK